MEVIEYGNKKANIVLLQPVHEIDPEFPEKEAAVIRENTAEDFLLAAFRIGEWNRDLSPWKAPAVFGREDFGAGAAETLSGILKFCEDREKTYIIGGYSLAGLFALWAGYRTDLFFGVAAASPSVWFPGFTEFMKEHPFRSRHVYLSLGDREEKTRSPVMADVGVRIREAHALLTEQKVDSFLEWNVGSHFRDADRRAAKAFLWVMERARILSLRSGTSGTGSGPEELENPAGI